MACSEEADYGQAKEEQHTDSEETDPYTYESYSVSSEETPKASAAVSKRKVQPGKSCDCEKNKEKDTEEVPFVSSKHTQRIHIVILCTVPRKCVL